MIELVPFLKWVGGKRQIIDVVTHKIPQNINTYYEPFIGGGSVLLSLLSAVENGDKKIDKFVISDKNKDLIHTYKSIKSNHIVLIKYLKKLSDLYYQENSIKKKETLYYKLRDKYNNKKMNKVQKSALFIFLNKTCFRGLYREGPNGFNVGFGNYKNPNIYDKEQITQISRSFRKYKVSFKHSTYDFILDLAKKDDFVYLDPPYYPINETSFVKYHINGFVLDDHYHLFDFCNQLNKRKIKFLMSNSYTNFNRTVYKKYKIEKILCKRKIHSKAPQSTEYEVLISNY